MWGGSSAGKHLSDMHRVLGFIPRTINDLKGNFYMCIKYHQERRKEEKKGDRKACPSPKDLCRYADLGARSPATVRE